MKYIVFFTFVIIHATHAQKIISVEQISQLTGQPSLNNTGQVNVYGTDLGSMFLHSDGKIYFLFGDTFGSPGIPGVSGDWRSNTMAYTSDYVAADGILFDGWVTDTLGQARALLKGNHDPNDGSGEVTKIPTAGWSHLDRQYMWFMSVKQWGISGQWAVNFSEIAYSDDNGEKWVQSGTKRSANSNFIQVAIAEQSGYLHFWGIPAGRFGGVKIARVLPSKVLDNSAYQYYTGTDWNNNEEDAAKIIDGPIGEPSVLWNPFLQRWIMMYLNERIACIEIREAEHPHGTWSGGTKVVCGNEYPGLYGSYMLEKYLENDGETVYFLMSQWGPYNVFLMKVQFDKNSTSIDKQKPSELPELYALHQNFPNPFNMETRIKYELPESNKVSLKIFNTKGHLVCDLLNLFRPAGTFEIIWNGEDNFGQKSAEGVYFYQLMVRKKIVQINKMVLMR